MIEIINEMRSRGFNIDRLVLDGKIHRFGDKKKSEWYIGFQNHTRVAGELFCVVQYGSWKTGEIHTYQPNVEFSADDLRFVKQKIEEAKRKEKEEKERVQSEVSERCARFWESLGDAEIPPYLIRKRVRDLYGARSHEGNLFVPMRDVTGKLFGLQRIQADGSKFFSPGQKVQGCFHNIGDLDAAETIYIAEGFATGASIYEAIERTVVIAFNSGNLLPVCEAIRRKCPDAKIIICADDDQWTTRKIDGKDEPFNPGIHYAQQAAAKIGAAVLAPKFSDLSSRPTDFNDLHILEGLGAVKEQIAPARARRHFVVPLGFREKEYFFTSTSNQQIVSVRSFSDVEFYNLMPREYWEQAFPGVRGGTDFTRAKSELMAHCRAKGIFEACRVRGSGVWLDDGRVVVNQGDSLLVNGSRVEISEIKSRYFYTLGRALPELVLTPLSVDECELLLNITEAFKWQRKEFGPLMAGALIISKICGALPVRPHLWLTGGSQAGKSTLMERLIWPTLSGFSLYFLGGTSEAGLRQSLGSDSVPVIFDEFETNGPKSSEQIQACVELMRASWSESHGVIAKGSAGGNASFYQPRFSAIVSSIRTNLVNDADRSRFTIIELAPHGSDPEHWKRLSGLLAQYDRQFVDRLFVRTLGMVNTILASYEVIRRELAQRVGARFGQQYGMLLAGYWALKSDSEISQAEARGLVSAFDFEEEKDEARLTDEIECLNFLVTKKLRVGTDEQSIGSLISRATRPNPMLADAGAALELHGIRVSGEAVAIASNHTELRALLRDTKWANCWSKTLARLPSAEKNCPIRFCGKLLKATKIPLSLFE